MTYGRATPTTHHSLEPGHAVTDRQPWLVHVGTPQRNMLAGHAERLAHFDYACGSETILDCGRE